MVAKQFYANFLRHAVLALRNQKKENVRKEVLIQRFYSFPAQQPAIQKIIPKPIQIIEKEVKPKETPKQEIISEFGGFDLGKITKYISDDMIDAIECPGPNEQIKVKKETSTFLADIKLSEEEIKAVIARFSKEANIPITPIFRATAKGLSITAIIASSGSRFIIKKI